MVEIRTVAEATKFVRPNKEEGRQLLEIVLKQRPELAPEPRRGGRYGYFMSDPVADFQREAEYAFIRLGYMRRLDRPDNGKYLTYWASECRNWLNDIHRVVTDIGTAAYLAAMFAHGDVCYTEGNQMAGAIWALGLSPYQGRPAGDAWRRVLETGQLMMPIPAHPIPLDSERAVPVRLVDMTTGADITRSNTNLWQR